MSHQTLALLANGQTIVLTLDDTPTGRELLSLLPLTLTLDDYAQTEKIASLPRRLTTAGAPAGYQPQAGDLTYYAPWGNLALFYRDFSYAAGLIRLGRVISGLELLRSLEKTEITLQLSSKENQHEY